MGWIYHNKPPMGWPINWDSSLSKGLIGYWLMNEGGGQKVFDLSGNGNISVLVNNPTWVSGKFGISTKYISASEQYGNCGNLQLSPSTGMSIVTWIRANSLTGWRGILTRDRGITDWYLRVEAGIIQFTQDGGNQLVSNTTLVTNTWFQIVCTWDGTNRYIYINGVLDAGPSIDTGIIRQATRDVLIGEDWSIGTARYWDGLIDHIMLYNRSLSASEIAQLYIEPFAMFKDPNEIPLLDQYYAVGDAGIMTLNTGYWGPTY